MGRGLGKGVGMQMASPHTNVSSHATVRESQVAVQVPARNASQLRPHESKHGARVGTGLGAPEGSNVVVGYGEGTCDVVGSGVGDGASHTAACTVATAQPRSNTFRRRSLVAAGSLTLHAAKSRSTE